MTATVSRSPQQRAAPGKSRPAPATDIVPADEAEAVGVVEGGESVGIPSLAGVLKGVGSALAQPGPVTRGAGRLVRDWATIARGSDEPRPGPRDKRFADP